MSLHIENQHRFTLPVDPDRAFMFFTAAGEEHWVPGWKPTYVWPESGETCRGMVFITGHAAEFTIWQMAEFDKDRRRSRYSRTTPGTRTGFVDIHVTAAGPASCEVLVGYQLTALSAEGEASLADYQGSKFVDMIDGWRESIVKALPRLMSAQIR